VRNAYNFLGGKLEEMRPLEVEPMGKSPFQDTGYEGPLLEKS
jgi:hypothetical protein